MKIKTDEHFSIKDAINILLLLGIIAISVLMFLSVSYSTLCEDDFSWLGGLKDIAAEFGGNKLISAFRGAYKYYFTNEGAFLASFLTYFANPYVKWGLQGFHLSMYIILALYEFSIIFMVCNLTKDRFYRLLYILVILLGTFGIAGTGGCCECFLWFSGAVNYTVEFSLSFITIGLVVRIIKYENTKPMTIFYMVLASILGFLAGGGKLVVTAAHCSWLLIILVLLNKKLATSKKCIIPFVSSLAGAILNTVAPGNFARSSWGVNEGHETVSDALRDTFFCIVDKNKEMFQSTLLVIMLLLIFALVIWKRNFLENVKIPTWLMVGSLISIFIVEYVSVFPICLGNHTATLDYMRLQQSVLMIFFIMYLFGVTVLALYLRRLSPFVSRIVALVCAVLCLGVCIFNPNRGSDIQDSFLARVARDFDSGNIQKQYMVRTQILSTLETAAEGTDVILFLPYYETESMYGMGISEDPNNFVNDSIRNWKKINSLTVFYFGLTYPPMEG